jgi:hypothetical protein
MKFFTRHKRGGGEVKPTIAPTPTQNATPAPRALTTLERLEMLRSSKESQLQTLVQDLNELDAHISWVKRFPQVEKIVDALRMRQCP